MLSLVPSELHSLARCAVAIPPPAASRPRAAPPVPPAAAAASPPGRAWPNPNGSPPMVRPPWAWLQPQGQRAGPALPSLALGAGRPRSAGRLVRCPAAAMLCAGARSSNQHEASNAAITVQPCCARRGGSVARYTALRLTQASSGTRSSTAARQPELSRDSAAEWRRQTCRDGSQRLQSTPRRSSRVGECCAAACPCRSTRRPPAPPAARYIPPRNNPRRAIIPAAAPCCPAAESEGDSQEHKGLAAAAGDEALSPAAGLAPRRKRGAL